MTELNTTQRVNPDFKLEDFILNVLSPPTKDLIKHVELLREGISEEAIHKARVAIRTIRSNLKTFSPLLKRKVSRAIDDELRWLNKRIAPIRDVDVFLNLVRNLEIKNQDDETAAQIETILNDERNRHIQRLNSALNRSRIDVLLTQLVRYSVHPPIKQGLNNSSALDRRTITIQCVSSTWTKLFTQIASLPKKPKGKQLHQVRIQAKRCRYAYETAQLAELLPAAHITQYAHNLQQVLGKHNDKVAFRRWLKNNKSFKKSTIKEISSCLKISPITKKEILKLKAPAE